MFYSIWLTLDTVWWYLRYPLYELYEEIWEFGFLDEYKQRIRARFLAIHNAVTLLLPWFFGALFLRQPLWRLSCILVGLFLAVALGRSVRLIVAELMVYSRIIVCSRALLGFLPLILLATASIVSWRMAGHIFGCSDVSFSHSAEYLGESLKSIKISGKPKPGGNVDIYLVGNRWILGSTKLFGSRWRGTISANDPSTDPPLVLNSISSDDSWPSTVRVKGRLSSRKTRPVPLCFRLQVPISEQADWGQTIPMTIDFSIVYPHGASGRNVAIRTSAHPRYPWVDIITEGPLTILTDKYDTRQS